MLSHLRRWFLQGLITVAPLAITVWVVWQLYLLVERAVLPLLGRVPALQSVPGFFLTLAGAVTLALLIIAVGALAPNLIGAALLGLIERGLKRIPVVRAIFETVKQIGEVLLGDKRAAFQKVVLFEYPLAGCHSLGFVTADSGAGELVSVFLATTPNPTSGFLLLIPRRRLVVLPLTVEEGMRLVISGGALLSPEQQRRLSELALAAFPAERGAP